MLMFLISLTFWLIPSKDTILMSFQLLDKKQHERILSPFKKVVKWVEDTRSATAPYFDEVHEKLFKSKIGIQESLAAVSRN